MEGEGNKGEEMGRKGRREYRALTSKVRGSKGSEKEK